MAEVALGIAGSVAGAASLAGQICVAFQNLYTFLDSIKEEVHFNLQCVKDDILLLKDVVLDMSNDCKGNLEDLDLYKTSFELSIYRIERLLAMIQPIENTAQKFKEFQAIRATVRKKRLAEFVKEFDGVKMTLLLVHQHYMRKSTSKSLLGVGRRLAPTSNTSHGSAVHLALTDTNSTNNEKVPPCIKQPESTRRAAYQKQFQFLFGVLSIKSEFNIPLYGRMTSTNNVQHENENKIFQVRFAQWLKLGIIELQALKQCRSWTYQLRHYRIIPSESLLFQLCSDGDLRNVQRLFSKCLASPFDVSPNGQTVLHYAALSGIIELVKFLLQIGVDASAETIQGENALEYAMTSGHEETYYELARLFVYRGQVDPMKQGSRASILHSYGGPPEAFRYLILQDQFSIDPEERNAQGKTILHYQILHRIYYGESFQRIQILLNAGHYRYRSQVTADDFRYFQHNGYTALHCAVERWSWALAKEDEHTTQQAERLVGLLLEMGEDIHATSGRRFTPLTTIGEMIYDHSSRTKEKVIFAWLQLLSNAGYDLDIYRQTESQLERKRLDTSHHSFHFLFNKFDKLPSCVKSGPILDDISTTLDEKEVHNR